MLGRSVGYPKVTGYQSLSDFFTDTIDAYRSKRRLSRAMVAKRLGLAPSTLSMLLAGKRQITISILHQMASFLGVSDDDLAYLETIALLQRARNPEARAVLHGRLDEVKMKLDSGSVRPRHLPLNDISHVAEWFIPGLLVHLIDECGVSERAVDFDELVEHAQKFLRACGVPEEKHRGILNTVYDSSLLRITADEKACFVLQDVDNHFACQGFFNSLMKEMQYRIDHEFSTHENLFLHHTFTITKKDYAELQRRYRSLLDEYVGKYDSSKAHEPKAVVVVGVSAFPMIRQPQEEASEEKGRRALPKIQEPKPTRT